MRRAVLPFLAILLLSFAVAATSGGDLPRPAPAEHVQAVDHGPPGPDRGTQLLSARAAVDYAQAIQAQQVGEYVSAVAVDEWLASLPAPPPPPPTAVEPAPRPAPAVGVISPSSLEPCGGDLPPCYVKARESGGDYNAQNPSSSASGAWQFLDSTWAGYGGYARAVHAPPDVQDARARDLWAGGAGCSHWSAC